MRASGSFYLWDREGSWRTSASDSLQWAGGMTTMGSLTDNVQSLPK